MENNQKPEWFELAENDQPVSRPLKSKKSAPMRNLAFILAGILVIPMGAGVALLTHDSKSANAVETLNLTQDSPAATSSPQTMTSNAISMPTASRDDDDDDEGNGDNYRAAAFSNSVSSSAPVATPSSAQSNQNTPAAPATKAPAVTAPAVTAPAAITPPESASKDLILPPTKKVGDDDEDDDEKSDGKKSKKSDRDDDDEDDEDDEDDD